MWEILAWFLCGVVIIAMLYSVRDWIQFFIHSWGKYGKVSTIQFIIFIALLCTPAIVKDYAPDFYIYSIAALLLYVMYLLVHRMVRKPA